MSHIHIFSEIKKMLLDSYDIKIEDGLEELSKLIHDFKENG